MIVTRSLAFLCLVLGSADEVAHLKATESLPDLKAATLTNASLENFVNCTCGLTCGKQLGSLGIFSIAQSCACNTCAKSNLRGSVEMKEEQIDSPEKVSSKISLPVGDTWDSAHLGTSLLFCRCGKLCADARPLGVYTTYACFKFRCTPC
eukprot:symbB.v1.2.011034.t1/scaffold733.1/size168030/5